MRVSPLDFCVIRQQEIMLFIRDHKTSRKTGHRTYVVPSALDAMFMLWLKQLRPGIHACIVSPRGNSQTDCVSPLTMASTTFSLDATFFQESQGRTCMTGCFCIRQQANHLMNGHSRRTCTGHSSGPQAAHWDRRSCGAFLHQVLRFALLIAHVLMAQDNNSCFQPVASRSKLLLTLHCRHFTHVTAYLSENPEPWEWEWLANAMLTSVHLLKTVYCREMHEARSHKEVCNRQLYNPDSTARF